MAPYFAVAAAASESYSLAAAFRTALLVKEKVWPVQAAGGGGGDGERGDGGGLGDGGGGEGGGGGCSGGAGGGAGGGGGSGGAALKHYEGYNEAHHERSTQTRGLLMAEALGALHKTSLLIHMPNAKRVALGEQPRDQDSIEREARYVSSMSL